MSAAPPPAMRIKSHWFRSDRPKSPEEIAGAAAFIAWRVAQNALKTMRSAKYELAPGPQYFAFLSEFLTFLTLVFWVSLMSQIQPLMWETSMTSRSGWCSTRRSCINCGLVGKDVNECSPVSVL